MDDRDPHDATSWPGGRSEMDDLIQRLDWAATPVGARADWPAALDMAVAHMLASPLPMFLWWGETLVRFYNDAYRELLGPGLHPWLLGGSGRVDYQALWGQVGPLVDAVMVDGQSVEQRDVRLPVCRFGQDEEAWWDFRYTPIADGVAPGGVGGVLVTCHDVTDRHREESARCRAAAHQQFLSALDQALHHGADDAVLLDTLNRMLGEYLGANRVGFAEDRGDGSACSARQYVNDSVGGTGRLVYRDFPADGFAALVAGRTVHRGDVRGDLTLSDAHRDAHRAIGIRAMINVPILRDGRLTALLYAHWRKPRHIRADEIALVETVARRCWIAVELARSQALLAVRDEQLLRSQPVG